jgi:hypothetical protein
MQRWWHPPLQPVIAAPMGRDRTAACVDMVTAQAGHRIDAEHAAHMVMHVEMVIEALEG